jgi:hypothetical protein
MALSAYVIARSSQVLAIFNQFSDLRGERMNRGKQQLGSGDDALRSVTLLSAAVYARNI